ncbi:Fur family transcriptional regulator [Caulobacter sp. Root487D2Y]|uniref:transcriptional repressor n=1 Tax=Caulobacter sp. Root487D2Y TaxID=1736547 RepID=UPI0006FC34B5|nr:transcriptional repressor [Caulobacter sp. Root487D2Y]KQY32720.1 Fur family transcriptional regulator [Caulobacter sp. Root487D2Y]
MPHTVEAVLREELRRAGLAGHGALPRLLALLRASPEVHLTLAEVADLVAEAGLAITSGELARQLELLADHGLVGRLPTTTTELAFDTVPEPHSHLVYEESGQVVDLHVSADTLLAMVRDALAKRPDSVEITVRFRRDPATAPAPAVRIAVDRAGQDPES